MADFNRRLAELQDKSKKMQEDLLSLLKEYDGLYREANTVYLNQRMAGDDGLEDFHILLNLVRRNRDIFGSLNQGARNIKSTGQFKFIEEDDTPKSKKESPAQIRQKRKKQTASAPVPNTVSLNDVEAKEELEVINV